MSKVEQDYHEQRSVETWVLTIPKNLITGVVRMPTFDATSLEIDSDTGRSIWVALRDNIDFEVKRPILDLLLRELRKEK